MGPFFNAQQLHKDMWAQKETETVGGTSPPLPVPSDHGLLVGGGGSFLGEGGEAKGVHSLLKQHGTGS